MEAVATVELLMPGETIMCADIIDFTSARRALRPVERPLYSAEQLARYNAASVAAHALMRPLTLLDVATALYGPPVASELPMELLS